MLVRVPTLVRNTRQLATFVLHESPSLKKARVTVPPAAGYSETVLDNGVRVATNNSGTSQVAKISVYVKAGSRNESYSQKGSAHLVASTAFTGTNKRSGLRLLRDLENAGAEVDASADRDKIVFSASVYNSAETTPVVAAGLFEAVAQRKLNSHTVHNARDLMERKYGSRCEYAHIKELLHEAAFGERAPLATFYSEDVHNLSQQAVDEFVATNFTAENVSVYASGVAHADLVNWASEHLASLPAAASSGSQKAHIQAPKDVSVFVGGEMRVRIPGATNSLIGLGFPVPHGQKAKTYEVLGAVLRSQLGCDSGVCVFVNQYSNGGMWGLYVDGETEQAVDALRNAVQAVKNAAGNESVINAAKSKLTIDAHLGGLNHLGSKRIVDFDTAAATDYSDVTVADVSAAVSASLQSSPAYAVRGQTYGVPSYSNISKLLK